MQGVSDHSAIEVKLATTAEKKQTQDCSIYRRQWGPVQVDALAEQLAQAIAQRRQEPDEQKAGQRVAEWQSAWDEILRTTIPNQKVRL